LGELGRPEQEPGRDHRSRRHSPSARRTASGSSCGRRPIVPSHTHMAAEQLRRTTHAGGGNATPPAS
jgi:hypothetical protein